MAVPTSGSHPAQCPASLQRFPLERVTRGGWARGLRSGHAQAYATLSGLSDLFVMRPPEWSQGMKVVWTSRGTPEHRDSGA